MLGKGQKGSQIEMDSFETCNSLWCNQIFVENQTLATVKIHRVKPEVCLDFEVAIYILIPYDTVEMPRESKRNQRVMHIYDRA